MALSETVSWAPFKMRTKVERRLATLALANTARRSGRLLSKELPMRAQSIWPKSWYGLRCAFPRSGRIASPLWDVELLDEGEIEVPIVQTYGGSHHHFPMFPVRCIVGRSDGQRIKQDADAGSSIFFGETRERRRHLRARLVLGRDQGDNNVSFLKLRFYKSAAAANKFVDFSATSTPMKPAPHRQ